MQKNNVTVAIYLDTHPKRNGLFPTKLRITHQRNKKYYPLGMDFSKEDFEKIYNSKPKGEFKVSRQILDTCLVKAREIINTINLFSFEAFEEIWYGENPKILDKQNVYLFIEDRIKELKKEERVGSAKINGSLLSGLKQFRKTLKFTDVTVFFLKEFEKFLLQRGNNSSTIGIYLREFRIIINLAIREKIISQNSYPFAAENNGYIIPTGAGTKPALTLDEFKEIINFIPNTSQDQEDKARDFFVFSCLSNGMNFTDICHLKHSNIKDGVISFLREKTKNKTRSKPIIIKVYITEPMKDIIEKWGKEYQNIDDYIFKELTNSMNAEERDKRVKQFIKNTNKYLRRIKAKLGIEKSLTTMVARHTFATILLRKGASTEYIKESLGHSNILTTENYLKGFDNSEREKWANALLE